MHPDRMNQELEAIFRELGIAQHLDTFVEQGFDTWETILDIQESDLDALGVKLGHRRKLQRRIANARGIAPSISLLTSKAHPEESKHDGANKKRDASDGKGVMKRKYRRHPKQDENAPGRPMSAYVLFSNKLREGLRGDHSLSFTEIAKLVGEHWQSLPLAEREVFESQARASKERFYREVAIYKETPEYHRYQLYLKEFKEKQAKANQGHEDAKRARLDKRETLRGSNSAGSSIVDGSTAPGGSTSTPSGSSGESMRESKRGSESREPPNLRHNSTNSLMSVPESPDSPVAPMPSPAATQFEVDKSATSQLQYLRRGSSSLRGITRQSNVPQSYLPSLSNILAPGQGKTSAPVTENTGFMHGFATANPRIPGPHRAHALPLAPAPPLYCGKPSGGVGRKLSDGHLPIHALLSDHDGHPKYRDERTSHTTSCVTSPAERGRPAYGQFQGPKEYGFQTVSSAFQNMKVEETSDGDVPMTSADVPLSSPNTIEVGGLDGVNALLKADEIFGHHGNV